MSFAQDADLAAALVARVPAFAADHGRYLLSDEDGPALWTDDPESAAIFPNMREAARHALRLPSACRAYGVLRHPEVMVARDTEAA